jgi:hypothetical protein
MTFAARCLLALTLLVPLSGQETQVSRTWIAGQEAGTAVDTRGSDASGAFMETRETTHLERMGVEMHMDLLEQARKRPDGSMTFTWSLRMSQEPQEGTGAWSPQDPGRLRLTFKDGSPQTLDIPPGALIWPGDLEDSLRRAARTVSPVRLRHFAFPTQQWAEVELQPVGPEALPGFPDTVRFKGRSTEGSMVEDVDLWISPSQGEVKRLGLMAGVTVLSQRVELPPPSGPAPAAGWFQRSLKTLPPNPFLLWLADVKVRWTGHAAADLPEDAQQRRLGPDRFLLARARPPTAAEALEPPVAGPAPARDAPWLAATPLV